MASTYSTNLAIELIGTGDQSGTWGTTTNTNLGTLIEQAISGYVTQAITDGADTTITIPNGATGVARNMSLELTGTLTAARNLIVPANKKLYFIYNNTTGGYAVTVKVSGQTGVSVPNGKKMVLVSNGTDVVAAVNYFSALSAGGVTVDGSTVQTNGMYLPTTNTLAWSTNSSERMRLDSSGNLGLGVTPSAWSGVGAALQVGTSAAIIGNSVNSSSFISNAYYDGTNYKYIGSGYATRFSTTSGNYFWNIAGSGTAGNTISFTQAMTLDVSGNLGIGMTPSAWVGSWKAVQGQGSGGVFAVASGGNGMYVMGNSYYNASGLPVYTSSSYATMYQQTSGTHVFYTAASGTAGNTITFTENGRFTAGGYFKTSNTGTYLNSTGTYSEFYQTANDVSLLVTAAASSLTQGCNGVQIYYPNATPNSTTATYLYCSDASAQRATIRSNGGIANFQANDLNLSDRREKHDFAPAKRYLDVVCAIPVQTFKYIDQTDDEPTLGVVAQDVQAVAPELVSESNWGTIDKPKMRLSVYQTDLQYALMKAIQDLTAEVQVLRDRVAQLETK
jgi:hypothetical protein